MGLKIKDATLIEEINDHLMLAVGNTDGGTDGAVTIGQLKDYNDLDKAQVAFTGSYLNLSDTPNLNDYVLLTTLSSNYYTRNQVNQLIGGVSGPKFVKMDELPDEGENNVIYLIPQEAGGEQNIFDEYVWLIDGHAFERIGSTAADFDNYYTIEEVDALIPTVGNATITVTQGGVTKGTFTVNQNSNTTIDLDSGGGVGSQEQADWNENNPSAVDYIKNKPTIPTVNNSTITLQQGGVTKGSITLNQSSSSTINFDAPVQADWSETDPNDITYINNKPDTMSLIITNSDNVTKLVDFYVGDVTILPDYLYIKNMNNGNNTITLTTTSVGSLSSDKHASSVQYSRDKVNWTTLNLVSGTTKTILMEKGDIVYFKNDSGPWNFDDGVNNWITSLSAIYAHNVGGMITSLTRLSYLIAPGVFTHLFANDLKLEDASDLQMRLIRVTNTDYGQRYYESIFDGCESLIKAPIIDGEATDRLTSYEFANAFRGCGNLLETPVLNSEGMADSCYLGMFKNCSSLTKAELPSVILAENCYYEMFSGCTSLNEITIKADDISATDCLTKWLYDVANSGTFHNLGSAEYTHDSPDGIPSGWTEVNN